MIGGFSPFVGTNLSYQGANQFFGGADTRLALANQATGNESPSELAALGAADKTAALQQAQGRFNYQYGIAWQEANDRKRKEENERGRFNAFA